MDTSKRGYIPMQERINLNKTQGASAPEEVKREPHWTAVKTILKYLRNTKDMFLVYGENPEAELRVDCYCNAGFETDRDDTKSQTRYVFILNGGAIMPPRMTTRSAGRPAAASRGGGTGGRVSRGGGRTGDRSGNQGNGRINGQGGQVDGQGSEVNDGVDGVPDFSTIIAQ
ncbi:hypothetical protein Tco_0117509 [Tanacetum coccineum]